ncbi:MAG: heparinase, partial [Candidatus Aminicenantes bacterium]|nr:heparinase [Candidatus Aminicenantes bacterium]
QEMGRYISSAYIADRYYINFADAAARLNPDASLIFRYGKSIDDRTMMKFGSFLAQQQNSGADYLKGSFGVLGRLLPALFQLEELQQMESRAPFARDIWFPELEVMAARSFAGSSKGLYLAAKGGHNAESHNHNDVGSFIVYADGYPALIDVGVETYTAKTFSSQRYEIWTMQSAYHNLPTVNGVMQREGDQYRASDVNYHTDNAKVVFELDISGAYPPEAMLKSWKRSLTLNRGRSVIIEDRYELAEAIQPMWLSFMSWRKPELIAPGTLRLHNPEGLEDLSPLSLGFDPDQFTVIIEELQVLDSRLQSSWGDYVYRILLTAKDVTLTAASTITLSRFGQDN